MNGRLVVVGAVNVDLVIDAPRLPGPGETVVGPHLQRHGGGKGGNAAVAAVRSGAQVRFTGAVGADDLGASALAELRDEGIDIDDVAIIDGAATGAALIIVDPAGENQIAVAAGANALVRASDVSAAIARSNGWSTCVLVSTEIPVAAVSEAVRAATSRGWQCVLNPAPVSEGLRDLLALGPMVTPNATELRDLFHVLGGHGAPEVEVMARTVASHSHAPVIVTMGADGVLLCDPDRPSTRIPATPALRVRDTTGAGDTFNGVFAASLAAGESVEKSVRRGVAAATLSVETSGARTSMPRPEAIDAALATSRQRAQQP